MSFLINPYAFALGGAAATDHFASNGANFPFSGTTYPGAIYVSAVDKTYVVWEGWTGTARRNYITYYDHTAEEWGPVVRIGERGLTNDAHGVPAIVRDNDGYLHVFGTSHNSDMFYWSSAAPDDITNWTGEFTISGDYTYAHPVNVGGTIYLFMREDFPGSSAMRLSLRKTTSVSSGVLTFGAVQSIVSWGTDTRFYGTQFLVNGTDIHFAASRADYADTFRADVYYFVYETVTGDVHNIEDDVTIVAADLPVDLTESNTDFRVVDLVPETNVPAFCFDTSGNVHLTYIVDAGSSVYTVKHQMFSGGTWGSTTDVGECTNRYDVVSVVPLAAGAVQVWWPEDDAAAWARGGTHMAYRERASGGTWGSETFAYTATTKALAQPNMVRDGHADLRVLFSEIAQTENNADAGNLKVYAFGDGGILQRQPLAPTDIKLSIVSISELWPTGQPFATLEAVDIDPDTHTYAIIADPDSKFSVSGNHLQLSAALDAGVSTSHSVTIRATDSYGLTFDKVLTINVIAEDTETMPVISTHSPSSVATLDISLPTGYRAFQVVGWLRPATDNVDLYLRTSTDGGSTFDAGASDYGWVFGVDTGSAYTPLTDSADDAIELARSIGNLTNEGVFLDGLVIHDPEDTTRNKQVGWTGSRFNASGAIVRLHGSGFRASTANVDAVRLLFSGGNIADGEITLIGIPS